jgi:hypothetical protein
MHAAPRDPAVALLPRTLNRSVSLARDVAIIHPAGAEWRVLAEKISAALIARGAAAPELAADTDLMPARSTPLPASYRARPLIFLGSLNTNRALMPLYADYLCSTDATYPGGDGFDLRTLVNPYGTHTNALLAGGSSFRGVERAVERLFAALARADATLTLPYLMEVEIEPALEANLRAWPYTPLFDTSEMQASRNRALQFYTEPIRLIGAYTLMWSWTADARYAAVACENLRALNERMTDGYGDWHYLAERFMRAVPLLAAGGFLTDEDINRIDRLLLLTALGNQDEWWRMREGKPPFGHRHQGKGTYEFLLLARYLRDQANPTPALRAQCNRWMDECCAFLDALGRARLDDQDDESCFNNLATLYRYSLGMERHEFFTNGSARLVAERALALHDNNGAGSGQGGYGESQGMFLQQEATVQTACSAFYYGDGELKWILQKLPNLAIAQRYSFLHFTQVFLQKFDTGSELIPVPPAADRGIHVLPALEHQVAISNNPPEHYEPLGHLINAPETWELPEAIALNQLPQARGFDKLVLRGGYDRDDPYLVVQGYQGGFRWQGHMQAANCIVRFFQHGHVFLVQNTSRHSYYDKNGLFISDGANDTKLPPIAERVASADFPALALTVTRLPDYHHTTWTRHIFWSKVAGHCFVVIDRVNFAADGDYSLTCSWRTPGYAEIHGRRWQSDQGDHRFTLVAGTHVASTCEEEFDQGACAPYVLRQRRAGKHRAGDEGSFQNLFYARAQTDTEVLDLQRLDERSALVLRNGAPAAWCAAALTADTAWLPGARAVAQSAWADAGSLALAGATLLSLPSFEIRSTGAFSVRLDFAAGTAVLQLDAPGETGAAVTVTVAGTAREIALTGPVTIQLSADSGSAVAPWIGSLRSEVGTALRAVRGPLGEWSLPALPRQTPDSPADRGWRSVWTNDSGSRVPERVRNVCITSDPLPIDNAPDQLLDPVLPDGYSREIWAQWPKAPHYTVSLKFPAARPVSALNILGDCIDDPSLRTFNPLPDGITVEVETATGARRACPVNPGPDRPYKRYRDAENRLETRHVSVGESARAFQVRFPAPSDGRPFVVHRLEVLSDRLIAPTIQHWHTADLNGDGRAEIITVNALNELIVLDADGRELWRRTLPNPVTHISAQVLDAAKPPVLCVGLLGGDLLICHADGSTRRQLHLAEEFRERKDSLYGWYNAVHHLAIWHRGADGRGSLVLGGYGIIVFLDADGRIVGHSFVDGPWAFNILVTPENLRDPGDIYVRCGWNHGVLCYKGHPGPGPSGEAHSFGGFIQPMFRGMRRVIPFLNGRSLAFEWAQVPACADGAIFAATELGCGLLSCAQKVWRWKLEGGMSLNAASLGRLDGRPVGLTGGQDGFVTAVDLDDGRVVRHWHAGAPIIGVAQTSAGGLVVATRAGVQTLDAAWCPQGALARDLVRALPVGDGQFLVSRADHTLELLQTTG